MLSKKLIVVVDEALKSLRAASAEFCQHRPKHLVFTKWNGCVESKLKLIEALENSRNIVQRRDLHAQKVEAALQTVETLDADAFVHLKAYQVDAWSVYDRLYDVYTRIAGGIAITSNLVSKSNVKLEELFKGKGEKLRLGGVYGNDALLIENFRWSYLVSYKIRNVIVHDGGYLLENVLFGYDMAQRSLALPDRVDEMLFKSEPESEKVAEARSSSWRHGENGFPWYGSNALGVLQKYNSDLDFVIGLLLHQAAVDFEGQVKYVCSISSDQPQHECVQQP